MCSGSQKLLCIYSIEKDILFLRAWVVAKGDILNNKELT